MSEKINRKHQVSPNTTLFVHLFHQALVVFFKLFALLQLTLFRFLTAWSIRGGIFGR